MGNHASRPKIILKNVGGAPHSEASPSFRPGRIFARGTEVATKKARGEFPENDRTCGTQKSETRGSVAGFPDFQGPGNYFTVKAVWVGYGFSQKSDRGGFNNLSPRSTGQDSAIRNHVGV